MSRGSLADPSVPVTEGASEEDSSLIAFENLGVKPDIEYEVTTDDLQSGFAGYRTAIQKGMARVLKR